MNPTRILLEVSPTVLGTSGHTMYIHRAIVYTVHFNNIILPPGAQGISLTMYVKFNGLQETSFL